MSVGRTLDFLIGVPLLKLLSFFMKKASVQSLMRPQKILIIKLAAVGDTLLLAPVLKNLKDAYPEVHIDWLVSPINYSVAQMISPANRVINMGGKTVFNLIRTVLALRKEKYEAIFDLEQWARGTALMSYFIGAPHRLGFETNGQHRHGLYTQSVKKASDNHEIFEFYNVLSLIYDVPRGKTFPWTSPRQGEEELSRILPPLVFQSKKLNVLIHPGCGADGRPREWPLVEYGVLINWIQHHWDSRIFISGGPDEKSLTHQLWRLISQKGFDLGGKLSWAGTFSLVSHMDLVISGNTGLMHVAAGFEKKQVALHGPTNPHLWGPLNPHAVVISSSCPACPCLKLGFEYHVKDQSCMQKISLEEVKKAVESLIDREPVI